LTRDQNIKTSAVLFKQHQKHNKVFFCAFSL